jgi:hypothetical protein
MSKPEIDEFLREGLLTGAEQAPAAPGLFEAVAGRVRRNQRRAVRTRIAASALATCAVAGIAVGVVAHPNAPARVVDAVTGGNRGSCPARSEGVEPTPGSATRLLNGTPTSVTLCRYGFTAGGEPKDVEAIEIEGADLRDLAGRLTEEEDLAKSGIACTMMKIDPTHLLLVSYAGAPTQTLVIDFSGCGSVSNGKRSVQIPASLSDLLRK